MKFDPTLWKQVQRIAYPKRAPVSSPPFPAHIQHPTPTRMPASWLYHKLAGDSVLRAKVLP